MNKIGTIVLVCLGLVAGVHDVSRTGAQTTPLTGEIAYVENGDIRLLDLASGQSRQLTTDGHNASPAWAPDGRRLAFVGDQFVTAGDIYTINADGTGRTRVTNTPQEQKNYVSYTPDGALLYVRLVESEIPQDRNYRNAIVRREPSGAETVLHTTELARCDITSLDYAPDGRLTIGTYCIAGRFVVLRDLQTGVETNLDATYLPPDTGCSYYAAWAGQRLAILTKTGCQINEPSILHLLDFGAGTTPPVAAPHMADQIGSLSWDPTGQRLVFDESSADSTDQGLWVWSNNSGPPVQVAKSGMRPVWRPIGASAPTATVPAANATPTVGTPDATATPAPVPSQTSTVAAPATPAPVPSQTSTVAAPAATETPSVPTPAASPTPATPDPTAPPAPVATPTPTAGAGVGSFPDQWGILIGMAGGVILLAAIVGFFILRRPTTRNEG